MQNLSTKEMTNDITIHKPKVSQSVFVIRKKKREKETFEKKAWKEKGKREYH